MLSTPVDHFLKVLSYIQDLSKTQVLVGVPADTEQKYGSNPGTNQRKPERGQTSTSINNAALAYIHNYGSPAANIPARPFMEPGIRDARSQTVSYFFQAGKLALSGKDPLKAYHAVGLLNQNAIRNRITQGPFVPLAPATIAARRRKRFLSDRPLIVTAQMRRSITYVIRRKGK